MKKLKFKHIDESNKKHPINKQQANKQANKQNQTKNV